MASYSPISSRNHRINTAPPYHISSTANSANPAAAAAANFSAGGTVANMFHGNLSGSAKRRESMNSSIGATSIRRLLTVNRGCRHKISSQVRAKTVKNFTLLIIAHGLMCAVLIPLFSLQVNAFFFSLFLLSPARATYWTFINVLIYSNVLSIQASNSMWFHQESWLLRKIGPNVGPLLLSICCLISSGTCLLTPRLIKKFGYLHLIIAHYAILCVFLLVHLYPTIWFLLLGYCLLGMTLGPTWICKWHLVVLFASRISCGQHECPPATAMMNETGDEYKGFCNRNERVRRLARWFHAVQDIGILVGALIASIIISCAATESNCILTQQFFKLNRDNSRNNHTTIDNFQMNTLRGIAINHLSKVSFSPNKSMPTIDLNETRSVPETSTVSLMRTTRTTTTTTSATTATGSDGFEEDIGLLQYYKNSFFSQHNELLDSLFNTNERGIRICGVGSCPTWNRAFESNVTDEYDMVFPGTIPMTLFYVILAAIALILSCLSQKVDITFKYEHFKGISDTLLLASPMAYFIGSEQGYVIGGFTRVSDSSFFSFHSFICEQCENGKAFGSFCTKS